MNKVLLADATALALSLDRIPNTSYFPNAIAHTIRQYVNELPEVQIAEDAFALYAHYSHGTPRYKLIVDTHLDHPGFILLGKGRAIPVGTIAEPAKVQQINERQKTIPVAFYRQDGKQVGDGHLHTLSVKGGRTQMRVHQHYPAHTLLPANTQAIPQVKSEQAGEYLLMRSADNLSVTALALMYLQWAVSARIEADITVIFTRVEEVRQVSAVAIAQRGFTPFGTFDKNTHIIVLEAGLVGSTRRTRQVDTRTPDVSYEAGTLLRVSDHEWPYQRDGQENLAEALLLHARDTINQTQTVKTQHGPSIGNCNALPFAFFSSCPHITSLMIPCVNKHNFDRDGVLVSEKIAIADMQSVQRLLEQATIKAQAEIASHPEQILLPGRSFPGNTPQQVEAKKKVWQGALAWAEPRLVGTYFSPSTPRELARCAAGSLKSRWIKGLL